MKIQILGSGCSKCHKLFANVALAVKQRKIECELEKVTDIEKIVAMGAMLTPALAVNEKIISSGKVLSVEEILTLLSEENPSDSFKQASAHSCCCSRKQHGNQVKRLLTILLLVFVVGSILYVIDRETKKSSPEATSVAPLSNELKVYYFHGTKRCITCNTIERLARETVEKYPYVKFIPVNVEERQHEHFVRDFQLVSRGVVMVRNGMFEKFDRTWELAGKPEALKNYLEEGIERLSK